MIMQEEMHGAVIKGDPSKDLSKIHLKDGRIAYLLYRGSDWVLAFNEQNDLVQYNPKLVTSIETKAP